METINNILEKKYPRFSIFLKVLLDLALLYLFLTSIGLMGHSFKGFGKGFAENLIQTTSNPLVGLFVGIFTTSIIQSSSVTTSMVVAFVASGVLTIGNAVPIVMGANIGTTVTSIIVAMGHITRKEEFRRALGGATLNDFFKIIVVSILLPLDLCTGVLRKTAAIMANAFCNLGGFKVTSPVKMITKPLIQLVDNLLKNTFSLPPKLASGLMLIIAVVVLFCSLYYMVKIMKSLMLGRANQVLDRAIAGRTLIAMFTGMVFTATIQSSSVTTSLLVPLVAAGILSVENAFPITLGADIGTTITAMLAALAGNVAGITIAFVHFLFNVIGILIIYPWKATRAIPIRLAKGLANKCADFRKYAIIFVLATFYGIPGLIILIYKLLK